MRAKLFYGTVQCTAAINDSGVRYSCQSICINATRYPDRRGASWISNPRWQIWWTTTATSSLASSDPPMQWNQLCRREPWGISWRRHYKVKWRPSWKQKTAPVAPIPLFLNRVPCRMRGKGHGFHWFLHPSRQHRHSFRLHQSQGKSFRRSWTVHWVRNLQHSRRVHQRLRNSHCFRCAPRSSNRIQPVILLHPAMALDVADTTTTPGPTLYHHQWGGALHPVASNHLSHCSSHCPGSSGNHHELLQFGDGRTGLTGGLERNLSSRTSSEEEDISSGNGTPYYTCQWKWWGSTDLPWP